MAQLPTINKSINYLGNFVSEYFKTNLFRYKGCRKFLTYQEFSKINPKPQIINEVQGYQWLRTSMRIRGTVFPLLAITENDFTPDCFQLEATWLHLLNRQNPGRKKLSRSGQSWWRHKYNLGHRIFGILLRRIGSGALRDRRFFITRSRLMKVSLSSSTPARVIAGQFLLR